MTGRCSDHLSSQSVVGPSMQDSLLYSLIYVLRQLKDAFQDQIFVNMTFVLNGSVLLVLLNLVYIIQKWSCTSTLPIFKSQNTEISALFFAQLFRKSLRLFWKQLDYSCPESEIDLLLQIYTLYWFLIFNHLNRRNSNSFATRLCMKWNQAIFQLSLCLTQFQSTVTIKWCLKMEWNFIYDRYGSTEPGPWV